MAEAGVFLNATDIEKSIAFYEALGFEVESRRTTEGDKTAYADLDMDGAYLGLGAIDSSDDPDFQEWVSGPLGGGVMLHFEVDDVDAIHERARDAGAVIEFGPTDQSYGRSLMLNDPDGYVVYFVDTSKATGEEE